MYISVVSIKSYPDTHLFFFLILLVPSNMYGYYRVDAEGSNTQNVDDSDAHSTMSKNRVQKALPKIPKSMYTFFFYFSLEGKSAHIHFGY